jgi:hypothetical protein
MVETLVRPIPADRRDGQRDENRPEKDWTEHDHQEGTGEPAT